MPSFTGTAVGTSVMDGSDGADGATADGAGPQAPWKASADTGGDAELEGARHPASACGDGARAAPLAAPFADRAVEEEQAGRWDDRG